MENDFPISQIVQRYDLAADKDLLYSYEELRRLNLDQRFIYTLLQTFEDEKTFSEKEYEIFSLSEQETRNSKISANMHKWRVFIL